MHWNNVLNTTKAGYNFVEMSNFTLLGTRACLVLLALPGNRHYSYISVLELLLPSNKRLWSSPRDHIIVGKWMYIIQAVISLIPTPPFGASTRRNPNIPASAHDPHMLLLHSSATDARCTVYYSSLASSSWMLIWMHTGTYWICTIRHAAQLRILIVCVIMYARACTTVHSAIWSLDGRQYVMLTFLLCHFRQTPSSSGNMYCSLHLVFNHTFTTYNNLQTMWGNFKGISS